MQNKFASDILEYKTIDHPWTIVWGSILGVGYREVLNFSSQLSHPLRCLQINGGFVSHLSSERIPWSFSIKKV